MLVLCTIAVGLLRITSMANAAVSNTEDLPAST